MLYNMILTDYKQADISNDGTVIKYNYPEDKLKSSLKKLNDWLDGFSGNGVPMFKHKIKKIFGAELTGDEST